MIAPLLEEGLPALGLTPPPGAVEQLDQYARLLLEKNQVMNLTSAISRGKPSSTWAPGRAFPAWC